MDWLDFIIQIVLPFGPALFLWGLHLRGREISRERLMAVFLWTVLMLGFATHREIRAEGWRKDACKALEGELGKRSDDYSDDLPTACSPDESEPRERF